MLKSIKSALVLAATAAGLCGTSATAAVVTFDELGGDSESTIFSQFGPSVTSGGLTFTARSGVPSQSFFVISRNASNNGDPGGATLSLNTCCISSGPDEYLQVTLAAGGLFTLNSLDLTNFGNNATATPIRFIFNTAAGREVVNTTLDTLAGMQTFSLNRSGLTSFEVGGRFLQVDNVNFSSAAAAVGAVPEPETWAMMIAGLGLVGGIMRRGRRMAPAALA